MKDCRKSFVLFDGAMGTMLQARGLRAGDLPERLNLTHPDVVREIHAEYVAAGADVITANTFGANARKLAEGDASLSVEGVVAAAVRLAREAADSVERDVAVALDIGPSGALLEPLGTLSFDAAYALFAEVVRAGAAAGADLVLPGMMLSRGISFYTQVLICGVMTLVSGFFLGKKRSDSK